VIYERAFIDGLTPDPDLTVSEWADEFRMLSQKASAEPGRWRTDRTPYLREIMDELSPSSPTQRVVFQAGAQVGKTETGNNWTGFIIHMSPGPMMLVQPTVDMAKRLSKQRLAPMIEESPVLRERIAESRSRDSGNTTFTKEFPGGFMLITGANSAVGLRSMPVRFLFLDEIDGFPVDLDGEGDPVNLAERRTTTFARRKIFMCSTPTVKDTSRIEREYLASDQRRFFIPCPHCGEFQWLKWAQIKWDDGDPDTAHYVCEHNGCIIEEHSKTDFMSRGEWRPTAKGDARTAGFHLSSLYSPLGWKSWSEIVAEFLAAKGDPPLLKTWVNTILGETWEDEIAARVGAGELQDRVEFYPPGIAPAGVLACTAGVDVQDNRLAVTIHGWGEDEECWLIDHQEIFGDPAKPEIWKQLANVISTPVEHEAFEPLPIMATCIDSGGHFTHEVYAFAREHRALHVMAVKGQSQKGKPVIARPTKVDLNMRQQVIKNGAEVWPVGTDTAKFTIYSRLKLNEAGAGFVHFHAGLPPDYFTQLTAEKLTTRYVKGHPVREWTKKPGARNEALDTFVYSLAALQSLYMRFNRKTVWQQMAQRCIPKTSQVDPKQQAPSTLQKPVRRASVRRTSSFVTNW
jgi:phage terminase large subunit GpA-like protein